MDTYIPVQLTLELVCEHPFMLIFPGGQKLDCTLFKFDVRNFISSQEELVVNQVVRLA